MSTTAGRSARSILRAEGENASQRDRDRAIAFAILAVADEISRLREALVQQREAETD